MMYMNHAMTCQIFIKYSAVASVLSDYLAIKYVAVSFKSFADNVPAKNLRRNVLSMKLKRDRAKSLLAS